MTTRWSESDGLQRFLAGEGWRTGHPARQMGAANRHRVFLLTNGARQAVLKLHEPSAAGRRDGFAHEARLHSFYAEQAGDYVPRLLAQDAGCRALLFEYVQGAPLAGSGASSADVAQMVEFLLRTNRPEILERARQSGVPAASDCGLSAAEHWQCASSRLDALLGLKAADEAVVAMQDFVRSELRPALATSKPDPGPAVLPCLSPSDFGFHNVIRRESGSLCFIDFEHAGWDDPAKLSADFILQPEAPLSAAAAEFSVQALNTTEPFGHDLASRVRQILPIQKCKWAAIILNVFGREAVPKETKSARLAKAIDYWRSALPVL
jgi:hypothetical protein